MKLVYSERIKNRLDQIVYELSNASGLDYHDRLREFRDFIERTQSLSKIIANLPQVSYDFNVDWRYLGDQWPGGDESYAMRWDAINQIVAGGTGGVDTAWMQFSTRTQREGIDKITQIFVIPLYNYLIDRIDSLGLILYILLRYKRWAEWFAAEELRKIYDEFGENGLDQNLRRFLFESGIDYPFSQPRSPGGQADIVAGLETEDPLVLEIKVWDTEKGYRENRIRDGLRQAIDYATKYGKEKGYVVIFNLDDEPLVLTSGENKGAWPPKLEIGDATYYFITVNIAEITAPVSRREKGRPVRTNTVNLQDLLDQK